MTSATSLRAARACACAWVTVAASALTNVYDEVTRPPAPRMALATRCCA